MSTDITLNGVGYMLAPKTYRADATTITVVEETVIPGEEGEEGTPAVPAVPPALSPSQRRGRDIQTSLATRGAVAGGVGGLLPHVGPAWRPPFPVGATGLGPPPLADARGFNVVASSGPRHALAGRTKGWLTTQDDLKSWIASSVSNERLAMGANASGLALIGDVVYVAFGGSQDVASWDDGSNTWTTSVLGAGEEATLISSYQDRLVTVPPDEPNTLRLWSSALGSPQDFTVDGEVLAMLPVLGGLLIATSQSWYTFTAATPEFTERPALHSNDVHLTTYQGRTYASVNGRLYRRSGLTGAWTRLEAPGDVGQLVGSADWLYALVATDYGASGLWVTDGDAWFFVNSGLDFIAPGPARLVGGAFDGDDDWYVFDDTDPDDSGNYATAYQAATTLQGATLARDKQWLQLGAEFHRGDSETVGSATAQLQYSTNAGRTWSNAGSAQAVNDEAVRIVADISGAAVSGRALAVRVNVTITSGIAPVLAALWADWEVTAADGGGDGTPAVPAVPDVPEVPETTETTRTPTLFRRWRFTVPAQDQLIDRDGALLGLSASQIRSNIWARLNQTSAFTDIDGTMHGEVTVTNIEEEWPSPSDAALNVSTRLKVTLVEGDQTID